MTEHRGRTGVQHILQPSTTNALLQAPGQMVCVRVCKYVCVTDCVCLFECSRVSEQVCVCTVRVVDVHEESGKRVRLLRGR